MTTHQTTRVPTLLLRSHMERNQRNASAAIGNGGTDVRLFSWLILLVGYMCPSMGAGSQPDAVVRKLYHEIVARRPLGIPKGADRSAIWPFLSSHLTNKLEIAQACETDYIHQHPGNDHKPEFGWLESGLFSGENEEALPAEAIVERTEPQKDGSFLVFVKLAFRGPAGAESPYYWQVAAKVISQGGQFRVDDILLFKDDSTAVVSRRLSESFAGCNGSQWIGQKTEDK
jgi:hypothetical protein